MSEMKELSKERIRGHAAVDGDGYQDINDASWSFSDAGLQKFAAAIIKEDRALNAPADRGARRQTVEDIDAILYQCDRKTVSIPWLIDCLKGLKERAAAPAPLAEPDAMRVPEGWKLVPTEPTDVHAKGYALGLAQKDRPAEQQGEPDPAYGYASRLAKAMHDRHFPGAEHKHWMPLPDTLGVLTQIDNMTCGLVQPTPPVEQGERQPVIYKRSEFTKGWTTFNVRRECADIAEARLKGPSTPLAELRAEVEALPVTAYYATSEEDGPHVNLRENLLLRHFDSGAVEAAPLIGQWDVLALIDKIGGKV